MAASGTAARRLRRELDSLGAAEVPQIAVQPSSENFLHWHFVLHSFDTDTPYHGGCYHGKIIFPARYPLAPPSILMVTPSGRLETGQRLCLSMTDFHPESWNPAWSVETILVGLLSFFVSDKETGYGAVNVSDAKRRQLALQSHAANRQDADFASLFPELLQPKEDGEASKQFEVAAADFEAPVDEEAPATLDSSIAAVGLTTAGITVPVADEEAPRDPVETTGPPAEEDEEPLECWICRDVTDEPLIQPCACRGSVGGVHASCVEDWIRHHRASAVTDEPPRCSVCHQFYRGQELQPGVATFLRQKCGEGLQQLGRTLLLILLVCGYQAAAEGQGQAFTLPLPVRVVVILTFSLAALHKLALLTVSLPLHRPPPESRLLREFFVADHRRLSKHIAEAFATVMILAFGSATGTLALPYFLPFGLASLIPVAKVCFRNRNRPSRECLVSWVRVLIFFVRAPFLCVGYPIYWTVRNPRLAAERFWHSLHPLGPGPQIYVCIASVALCLACMSNVAPVLLWSVHGGLMLLGLLELLAVRRLPWRRTRASAMAWLLALQLSALAAYYANTLCVFPEGFGAPKDTLNVVHAASFLWFLTASALGVKVNWAFIVEHYRVWQRRHGTFTLQVPQGQAAAAAAPPV